MRRYFRFLELPVELRVMIYDLFVFNECALLTPRSRGRLFCTNPLLCVNEQIRKEYSVEFIKKSDIIAKVKNFDFAHIITYLNKLSPLELRAITPSDTNSYISTLLRDNIVLSRRLHIQLLVASTCPAFPDEFVRWLNRLEKIWKNGTQLMRHTRPV